MKKIYFLSCFALLTLLSFGQAAIKVEKIWDRSNHNAFPDLYKFKAYYYVTFREGTSHVNNQNDGTVRLMRSKDMKNWETVTVFKLNGKDVREARLSQMPDGALLVTLAAGVWKNDQYLSLRPYYSISDLKGTSFTPLAEANIDAAIKPGIDWIWRVTWYKGYGYGVLYQNKPGERSSEWNAFLVRTKNGRDYEKVDQFNVTGKPNESTIRFDKEGSMYVLMRREAGDKMGYLAKSAAPYQNWQYDTLTLRLGGPNFLFLNRQELIIGSRLTEAGNARTALFLTDLHGKIKQVLQLPGSGDGSYPGMVIDKNQLHVVYYSSHKGKAAIYAAEIPLSYFNKKAAVSGQ